MLLENVPSLVGNRYELEEKIGEGGMGVVYKATDRLTNDVVALKYVTAHPDDLQFASRPAEAMSTSDAEAHRIALANEFQVLSSVRHPNIISVLDYGFDHEQRPYFTMEYLPDPQTILRAGEERTIVEKMSLIVQVLQALSYLHRRGLLHRDLKPANVMVVKDRVKLVDFGLAGAPDVGEGLAGTYAYMAPEILRGDGASAESDLYAVGILAFELVAEQHPHETENLGHLLQHILFDPVDLDLMKDADMVGVVIGRLLEKEPSLRYKNADEVSIALSDAIGEPLPEEDMEVREGFLQAAEFIGREEELEILGEALAKAEDGQGSSWLVGGESGIGKTRLLNELRINALVKGVQVLRGQAVAEGGPPYSVWRPVIRPLCLQTDLATLEAGVLKAIVPDIESLLRREIPDAPEIDPQAARTRLLSVIEEMFARQKQPVLVLLEDLHWSSESLNVLDRLTRLAETNPLMLVGSYRNDESPTLPAVVPKMKIITLYRLDRENIEELTASILGKEAVSDGNILDLLQRETEGNVFFIVEVIRALAKEAGRLDDIRDMTLPRRVFAEGVMNIVRQRLNRIPEDARDLLAVAAVASRALDLDMLRQLERGTDFDVWLTTCSEAAVLDVQDNRWQFAHDRLREAILDDLTSDEKRAIHKRIAGAMEHTYLNDQSKVEQLAYHWAEAGDLEKEAHYSALTGEQAIKSGAYQNALPAFERALELAPVVGTSTEREAFIEQQLGVAIYGMGQLSESRKHMLRVLELLNLPRPQGDTAVMLALLGEIIKQGVNRILRRDRWQRTSEQAQRFLTGARAGITLSHINYFDNNQIPAIYNTIKSLNFAERAGEPAESYQAEGFSSMAVAAGIVGAIRIGDMYMRLAERASANVESHEIQAGILRALALYLMPQGRWDETVKRLEESIRLADKAGDFRLWAEGKAGLLRALYYQGRWDRAIAEYEEVYNVTVRQNDVQYQGVSLVNQAEYAVRRGEYEDALTKLTDSLPRLKEVEDSAHVLFAYGLYIQTYVRLGELDKAAEYIRLASEIIESGPPTAYWTKEGYIGVAEYYLTLYEKVRSRENRQRATHAVKKLQEYAKVFDVGKPRAFTFQGWLAYLNGRESKSHQLGEKGFNYARLLMMPYEEAIARARLVAQVHPEADKHRAEAVKIFERLGADAKPLGL